MRPMQVLATAGHVDHGKSTLVRALTGIEPDRLDEERRRGLTIDLGFAWTGIGEHTVAFVDVPGHRRFVANMLTGTGPVTTALFVVAADAGWQAQSSEHLAALDAFGVRHGVLAVTKADKADPAPVLADAAERLALTTLGSVGAVAVSGTTGEGLDALAAEIAAVAGRVPAPDTGADVRLWIDRVFTVRGAGTVVTGTLGAGTLRVGDELTLSGTGQCGVVRGLQSLGEPRNEVPAVARVAVNLRGLDRDDLRRGEALLTPGAFRLTREADVRLRGAKAEELHSELVLHLGAAAMSCRVRPLGADLARLSLSTGLALRAGDAGLLRAPGEHQVPAGVEVLDPRPPALRHRGAARARALELTDGDPASLFVRRHGVVEAGELHALGFGPRGGAVGRWMVSDELRAELPGRAAELFAAWRADNPLAAGMPLESLRRRLDVPADLLTSLLEESVPRGNGEAERGHGGAAGDLEVVDGLLREPESAHALPGSVDKAVTVVERRLAQRPFHAPEAEELARLELGPKELAAAERAGRLLRIADGIVLAPGAVPEAARVLAALGEPCTVSRARKALETTRRVAVPLLERLDTEGYTRRHPDGTRTVSARADRG